MQKPYPKQLPRRSRTAISKNNQITNIYFYENHRSIAAVISYREDELYY